MVESLNAILPIFIYLLLMALIVVGIILGIKLIITIDKINRVVDDLEDKVASLNGVFRVINGISDKFSLISSKVIDTVVSLISRIGNKKNREDEADYE